MTQTLDQFVDESGPFVDELPPIIIDRSTLERYAECPHQAYHVEHRNVSTSSEDTETGNEVHDILARAVAERHEHGTSAHDLRELIDSLAVHSRPDVQPAVISSVRRSSWSIIQLLCTKPNGQERHPEDLLCFDGGRDEFSAQLAADILPANEDRGPVRLTCELDLVLATASERELDVIDWKSGWKWWTASEVRDAFQFQFYAWVAFNKWPSVDRLNFRVFMTRENTATSPVTFDRSEMFPIYNRLKTAVDLYLLHHDSPSADDVPAWPLPSRCSLCPAASICLMAHRPAVEVAIDPAGAVLQLAAMQAAADQMKANLTSYRRGNSGDIEAVAQHGLIYFGTDAPKAVRAKACDIYEISVPDSTSEPSPKPRKKKQPAPTPPADNGTPTAPATDALAKKPVLAANGGGDKIPDGPPPLPVTHGHLIESLCKLCDLSSGEVEKRLKLELPKKNWILVKEKAGWWSRFTDGEIKTLVPLKTWKKQPA
jgi:hypothetical protein